MAEKIRPIAIGVVIHEDKLFVFEGYDHIKPETFYRPLGGGIDFYEPGIEAVKREFQEELKAELKNLKYLSTLENIFIHNGERQHEIVLIYKAEFADKSFYEDKEFTAYEDDGSAMKCLWVQLKKFRSGELILYPDGLIALL